MYDPGVLTWAPESVVRGIMVEANNAMGFCHTTLCKILQIRECTRCHSAILAQLRTMLFMQAEQMISEG